VVSKKKTKSPNNPITSSIRTIRGYPSKLIYYRIPDSKYYQARVFHNGRLVIRSLRTDDEREAKQLTVQFYEGVITNKTSFPTGKAPRGFTSLALHLIESYKEHNPRQYKDDKSRLSNGIISFFKEMDVEELTNADLQQFYQILVRRKLKPQTINHYFIVIKKVLKHAYDQRLIKAIPSLPKIKNKTQNTSRRSYLELKDYRKLTKQIEKLSKEGIRFRGVEVTEELKYLIQFSINSFIRPSDLKILRNKHISIRKQKLEVEKRFEEYLVLNHPATKTTDQPVVTMPVASSVYKKQLAITKENGFGDPEDYVFYPQYKNRTTFLSTVSRLFKFCIREAGLEDPTKQYSLYSLRHTAIIYRILKGENIDLLTLAKNARTSVAMIEQYYTRDLSTVLSAPKLHSFKK